MTTPVRPKSEPSGSDARPALSAAEETESVDAASSDGTPAGVSFGAPVASGEVGTLGPYRLVKELGRGGMGAVYAAVDTRLDRRLALKLMLPKFAANAAAKERFLREARAAAKISHDNVVTVYEADERGGMPYIAMQFLEGYPLDEYLKKHGNPSIPQVLRIAAETAAGLAAAHKTGLVHRDIKPANLWLEAPNGRVKVLDFGLAKPVDAEVELTKSGMVVGTPAYMSPEQARGEKVDHRTDLFSLGCVLYRLCTGRLPFHGPTTMAVLLALATEEPPPARELNPEVPESLAALVHQLLAKRADARPHSAADVVKELRAIAEELKVPRALPVEESTSQPHVIPSQVVYVPIQVTAAPPEQNPFAELDVSASEVGSRESATVQAAAPEPVRKKPGGGFPWTLAGALAFAALMVGGVIILIRNKDGTETKIEVPDGATVTVQDKGGKTLAKVGPDGKTKPDPKAADPDRAAAEWVLKVGGSIAVDESGKQWLRAVPSEPFRLTGVLIRGTPQITDADFAVFAGCRHLTYLSLNNVEIGDAGFAHFRDSSPNLRAVIFYDGCKITDKSLPLFQGRKDLLSLQLSGEGITDAGLAGFAGQTELTDLLLYDTKVTDAGLASFHKCTKLTRLIIRASPGVTDAGLRPFRDAPLEVFTIYGTGAKEAGAWFLPLKTIREIDLSFTYVSAKAFEGVTAGRSLQYLWLVNVTEPGAADAVLGASSACRLTDLRLSGSGVTAQGLAKLEDPGRLGNFGLDNTSIGAESLPFLKRCGSVGILSLGKTKMRAEDIADLARALPSCQIQHDGGVTEPDYTPADRAAVATAIKLGGTAAIPSGKPNLQPADLIKGSVRPIVVNLNGRKAVTDADLAGLRGSGNLISLALEQTAVGDAGLEHLSECRRLRAIFLTGTNVTDKGLTHLRTCRRLASLTAPDLGLTDAAFLDAGKHWPDLSYLLLTGNPITDRGLAGLAGCADLGVAHFQRTKITDDGLGVFAQHTFLTTLYLDETAITDVGLAKLAACKRLTTLSVRKTKVTAKGLEEFHAAVPGCQIAHDGGTIQATDADRLAAEWAISQGGTVLVKGQGLPLKDVVSLPKERFTLTFVNLTSRPVTDAGLAHLKELKSLTYLNLSATPVTDAGLAHLKELKSLTHLDLSGTKVTDAGLAHLTELKSLTVLTLYGIKVTDAGLAHLKELKSLTSLNLSATPVTDAGLAHLAGLKSLTSLNVQKTKVTAKGLAEFHAAVPGCKIEHDGGTIQAIDVDRKAAEWALAQGGTVQINGQVIDIKTAADLPKDRFTLTYVGLSGPAVTDAGLAHLRELKSLKSLHLPSTAVTDAGLAHLAGLKSLTVLDVQKTKVSAKGLEAFHAAVPGCQIAHDGGTIQAIDVDRTAAEWVIGFGGTVRVGGVNKDIAVATELPNGRVALTWALLNGKNVADAELARLKGLQSLTRLDLYNTPVTDAGVAHLEALVALQTLSLNGTKVSDAGLEHLKNLKSLASLDLRNTSVSDTGLSRLHELKGLTLVELRNTKVTAKGLEAFHAAVTGCKIQHDGGTIEPKK